MRLSLVIGLAGALAFAAAAPAVAKGGPKGGGHGFSGAHSGGPAGFHSRGRHLGFAQGTQPRGWSKGRKTGWRCTPGTAGCIPPGLR